MGGGIDTPSIAPLGGNCITIYAESDGLVWAWGIDAKILAHILKLPLRTIAKDKTVTVYICFRYAGDLDELHSQLHYILPYNVALVR